MTASLDHSCISKIVSSLAILRTFLTCSCGFSMITFPSILLSFINLFAFKKGSKHVQDIFSNHATSKTTLSILLSFAIPKPDRAFSRSSFIESFSLSHSFLPISLPANVTTRVFQC